MDRLPTCLNFARKPPIAPIPLYQPLNCLQCYNPPATCVHEKNSDQKQILSNNNNNSARKIRPFDVENLIQESITDKGQKDSFDSNTNQIVEDNQNAKEEVVSNSDLFRNDKKELIFIQNNTDSLENEDNQSNDCITLYPGITINSTKSTNQNDTSGGVTDQKPKEAVITTFTKVTPKELPIIEDLQKATIVSPITIPRKYQINTNFNNDYFDSTCTYLDRSAEVKHARTPINTTSQQTHSPQLPVPSPNYPVQTQVSSDIDDFNSSILESSCEITFRNSDSDSKTITEDCVVNNNGTKLQFNRDTVIQIPNIKRVPTINNNYINVPPVTSHNEIMKNGTSFWDLHLPHSTVGVSKIQVREQECSNDITIKDLLTNSVDLSKNYVSEFSNNTSFNNATVNLNKVNTPKLVKVSHNSKDSINSTDQHTNSENVNASGVATKSKISTTKIHNATNFNVTLANSSKFNSNIEISQKPTSNPDNLCVVLNVPLLNFHQPPVKKQKLSKIDIATRKRKLHRQKRQNKLSTTNKENKEERYRKKKKKKIVYERITTHKGTITKFGVHVFGYSDSSSSSSYTSSECESDTVDGDLPTKTDHFITTPDIRPEKVKFLQLFGLTTYTKKDAVELSKLERRKWQPTWNPAIEKTKTVALDLPVPSASPSVLNTSQDYHSRATFLHILGLQTLNSSASDDYEKAWLKIVGDRLKRKCESAVTEYSLRVFHNNLQKMKAQELLSKNAKLANDALEKNGKFDQNSQLVNGHSRKDFKCEINIRIPNMDESYKQTDFRGMQILKPVEKYNRTIETENGSKCFKTPIKVVNYCQNTVNNQRLVEKTSKGVEIKSPCINYLPQHLIKNCQPKLDTQRLENGKRETGNELEKSQTVDDNFNGAQNNYHRVGTAQQKINILSCVTISPSSLQHAQNQKLAEELSRKNRNHNGNIPVNNNRNLKHYVLPKDKSNDVQLLSKGTSPNLQLSITDEILRNPKLTDKKRMHVILKSPELSKTYPYRNLQVGGRHSDMQYDNIGTNLNVDRAITNKKTIEPSVETQVNSKVNSRIPGSHRQTDEQHNGLLKIHNSKAVLKTPITCSTSTNLQQKDCKSTYIQTDPNYVLPLAMIVVDNRSIQQGIKDEKKGKDSLQINKEEVEDKDVQCVIKEDVANKKVQCLIKEGAVNKKVQCVIKEKGNSTSIQCSLERTDTDVLKWPGINKLVESYHLHSKDCNDELKSLKETLANLREAVRLSQSGAKNLECKLQILQSASLIFEQDRIQLQSAIDHLNNIINAFR